MGHGAGGTDKNQCGSEAGGVCAGADRDCLAGTSNPAIASSGAIWRACRSWPPVGYKGIDSFTIELSQS